MKFNKSFFLQNLLLFIAFAIAVCAFFLYQNRDAVGKTILLLKMTSDRPCMVQVFYSPNQNFCESGSVRKSLPAGNHSVKFILPESDNVKFLRIDPADRQGVKINVREIRLSDNNGTRHADPERLAKCQMHMLKCTGAAEREISLTAVGNDPQILLPVKMMPRKAFNRSNSLQNIPRALFSAVMTGGLFLLIAGVIHKFLPSEIKTLCQKWTIPLSSSRVQHISAALVICCIAALAAGTFAQDHPHIKIEMESDKSSLIQVFYVIRNNVSQQNSVLLNSGCGSADYLFHIPRKYLSKIESFRFDPSSEPNSTIKIKRITFFDGKAYHTLPLQLMSGLSASGIVFENNVSESGITGKVLNNDPYIYIPVSLFQFSHSSQNTLLRQGMIMLFSFALALLLCRCIARGGIIRKRTLLALTAVFGIVLVGFLMKTTDILGKFLAVILITYVCKYVYLRLKKLPAEQPETPRSNFDWSMHYFRAFAIANICIGHMIGLYSVHHKFFLSDSIYFLFISGYLCQYLFDKRPESPLSYYKKKVFNVIFPYLFFSLLIITAKIYFPALTPSNLYNGGKNFSDIASALLKGTCVGCYWYIPFVTVLFVFSPLFCRLKNTAFLQCLFFAAAVSAILPIRGSWTNCLTAVNLYTYFTFAYLFGIAFARYRKEMQPFFKQICFTALLLGIGLIYIINNKTFPFVTAHATFLHAIQKYFFTIVVLTLLEQFKHKYNYLLDQLAVYSFSIFFLHMIFEYDYWKTYTYISNKIPAMTEAKIFDSWQLVLFYITGGFCYLLLMLGISILLKKCIGKHSRYFIGS